MLLDLIFPSRRRHRQLLEQLKLLTMNLDALTSAVTGLSASVDAAVVKINTPVDSSADQAKIDALTAQLVAIKATLDAAVTPPATPSA